jgi:hypothetical protein
MSSIVRRIQSSYVLYIYEVTLAFKSFVLLKCCTAYVGSFYRRFGTANRSHLQGPNSVRRLHELFRNSSKTTENNPYLIYQDIEDLNYKTA